MSEENAHGSEPVGSAAAIVGPLEKSSSSKLASAAANTVFVAVTGAVVQFITDHSDEISVVITQNLPHVASTYTGGIVGVGISALLAYLRARSEKQQKKELVKALATPTPPDIDKYYKAVVEEKK